MITIFDCYTFMNLEPTCSDVEVRKAYRKMAKNTHPDKLATALGVSDKFYTLNEAYRRIINFRKKHNFRKGVETKEQQS